MRGFFMLDLFSIRHYSCVYRQEINMRQTVGRNRNIRLTDEEWETFKDELGIRWLREQIAKASKRADRKTDK